MTETETKWSERVKQWKASGESAKAFAQGREFKPSTLTYWAHRLRKMGRQAGAPLASEEPAKRPPVGMIRLRPTVQCRPSATKQRPDGTGTSSVAMVIAIGWARIEVRPGFDRALFTEIVEALGAAQ
jgi:hypothetical protein